MLDEIKTMFTKILEDDEFFQKYAALLKKSFDAMVAAGFTRDEAIELLKTQGTGLNTN